MRRRSPSAARLDVSTCSRADVVRDRVVQVPGDRRAFGLDRLGQRELRCTPLLFCFPLDLLGPAADFGDVAAAAGGVPAEHPRQNGVGEGDQDISGGPVEALDHLGPGHARDEGGERRPGAPPCHPCSGPVPGDGQAGRVADAVAVADDGQQQGGGPDPDDGVQHRHRPRGPGRQREREVGQQDRQAGDPDGRVRRILRRIEQEGDAVGDHASDRDQQRLPAQCGVLVTFGPHDVSFPHRWFRPSRRG
jgi:hypothetical protein